MKKILFIFLILFFVLGCSKTKYEILSSNFKQCLVKYAEQNFDLAKQSCKNVLEIKSKGPAADIAIGLIGMTHSEEEFIENADKYGTFPGTHVILGDLFFEEKDLNKSEYWYRKGAKYNINKVNKITLDEEFNKNIKEMLNKNILEAQTKLGVILLSSENEKEKKEGLMWLEKAAKQPYDKALYTLGLHYFMGIDVKQDYEKSIKNLSAAYVLGNADAMFLLGIMSFTGEGIAENNLLAYKSWANAYEKNHPGAKLLLEYDDFDSYVIKMATLKKTTTIGTTLEDIEYFISWLQSSEEVKQYLHKKQITPEERDKNMAWISMLADYGLEFAIAYQNYQGK